MDENDLKIVRYLKLTSKELAVLETIDKDCLSNAIRTLCSANINKYLTVNYKFTKEYLINLVLVEEHIRIKGSDVYLDYKHECSDRGIKPIGKGKFYDVARGLSIEVKYVSGNLYFHIHPILKENYQEEIDFEEYIMTYTFNSIPELAK